ncbi:hypothetical protein [Bifidobacterium bombi]|uniref:Uncharacterized protein n=1 Tax=Bifidobacterium bombi DSM 19703 TaxID=1341695 RepID=A0A080N230_9BIFI|nr:hypothetical protein [Bifidobacterium bombi]KFF30771.1 hypothetical protein BBOMB_0079 [Bifidobacterium bombi DSM 19703]
MKLTLNIISLIYALVMGAAAAVSYKTLPWWAIAVNVLFAVCLAASIRWSWLLPVGLLGLVAAAVMNGLLMYGQVHLSHVIVRVVISIGLLTFWHLSRSHA